MYIYIISFLITILLIYLVKTKVKNKKIKAAGGIKSFDDAEKFISLGANRLGTSRLIKIMKEG